MNLEEDDSDDPEYWVPNPTTVMEQHWLAQQQGLPDPDGLTLKALLYPSIVEELDRTVFPDPIVTQMSREDFPIQRWLDGRCYRAAFVVNDASDPKGRSELFFIDFREDYVEVISPEDARREPDDE